MHYLVLTVSSDPLVDPRGCSNLSGRVGEDGKLDNYGPDKIEKSLNGKSAWCVGVVLHVLPLYRKWGLHLFCKNCLLVIIIGNHKTLARDIFYYF